jgi:hypothetical protein
MRPQHLLVRAGLEARILAHTEVCTEAPAALNGASAVPVIAAATGIEHAAVLALLWIRLVTTAHPVLAAAAVARSAHRHAGDDPLGRRGRPISTCEDATGQK